MVTVVKRRTDLNSLWSIFYCILVLGFHIYITYAGIKKYHSLNHESLWDGSIPGALRTYLALIVVSVLFLPLFVFTSLLKVGNIANDGIKLGRDHALDCGNTTTIGSRIKWDWLRLLWEKFAPFSPVLHLLVAFLVLLPEVVLNAAEVKHGLRLTDAIWSCDMNFLYDEGRASKSNLIGLSNITILHNYSFIAVPTVKPEAVGWQEENPLHVAFVHLSAALIALTVKYASVFWFTNKVFGALFSLQLLFMTIDSLFAFCGISVLYKVSINSGIYQEHIHMVLSPGAVLALYILGGIVLLFSSIFLYDYGGNYFQEKFKLIDKHHHPEAYRKQTIIVHGSCQGYKTHTFAMASLIFVAVMKGPILYDLVSLYRATKDPLILSCIIIDVCYMVSWIVLWTILTLKQQWQFRILDYVPLNQPIYMVSNDPLIKSASFHGGSLELQIVGKKRPSSLPSELTTSESGFGDVNSSEDEKERFELSLPPLAENPGGQLRNSRRKGSTHSLDRKGRYRRNINQRVTFRDTVKRSTSNEDNLGARQRTNMNITADVHRISPVGRPASNSSRSSTPIDVELICSRNPGYRHSLEETAPRAHAKTLNNQRFQISLTEDNSARTKHKDINTTEKPHNFNRDFNRKNDYTSSAKSNLISSNIQTQTTLNNTETGGPDPRVRSRARESPNKETNNYMFPRKQSGATMTQNNRLQPRPLEFIDKTQEIGLSRRDSANYSLTSSQETASNESELIHQLGICSQEKSEEANNTE